MPSLRTFRIEFDRVDATYAAGEIVTGNIVLHVEREKTVRGLLFSTKGEARVHWTETGPGIGLIQVLTRSNHYSNSEEYYQLKCNILGSQYGDSRVQIPVGVNKYPFNFQLPRTIPCSFEQKHGHIRYTAKAVLDRPWKFNHECKAAFTVISHLDLNEHRLKCLGIDEEVTKTFRSFCCIRTGSINFRITIPSTGYVPGQSICTALDYANLSSSVQVSKISTVLIRTLKLHARWPPKKLKIIATKIASTENNGPLPSRGRQVTNLLIPPIPPSSLEYCNIIELEYKLVVSIHVAGPHWQIQKSYPLLIGTIPMYCPPTAPPVELVNALANYSNNEHEKEPRTMETSVQEAMPMQSTARHSTTNSQGDRPRQSTGPAHPEEPSGSSNTSSIPPPSYEECTSETTNIIDQDESNYVFGANVPFAPRYPVFNYPSPGIINTGEKLPVCESHF